MSVAFLNQNHSQTHPVIQWENICFYVCIAEEDIILYYHVHLFIEICFHLHRYFQMLIISF